MRKKTRPFRPESQVVESWQRQMRRQRRLADSEGKPVEVVYPGRPNDGRGADFREAVVSSCGQLHPGYIEVHSRVSGWQAHGHHRDPAYNGVVLHVAWEEDRPGKTMLENGESIPTVILKKNRRPKQPKTATQPGLACQSTALRRSADYVIKLLEGAGDARYAEKVARYQDELIKLEAGQSLYQGLAEALGYSKNKNPFVQLARRTPLSLLEKMVKNDSDTASCLAYLQATLLGRAGFLDSLCADSFLNADYLGNLREIWSSSKDGEAMPGADWELFKVRPGNHPVVRILALSQLLVRFRQKGLEAALLDIIRRTEAERSQSELESALMVDIKDCGSYAVAYKPSVNSILLGRERAAEINVNVLLPFTLAWRRRTPEIFLEDKVTEIYRGYGRLESNSIERHMLAQLALKSRQVNCARRQQGLIHIYKTYCIQGKCAECSLNNR